MPKLTYELEHRRLASEIGSLHLAWREYLAITTDPAEVRRLNNVAPRFFGLVQRCLLREVMAAIGRLTDAARNRVQLNLTLRHLLEDPSLVPGSPERHDVEAAIENAIEKAKPIRMHRHKYIAHLDRASAADGHSPLVDDLQRQDLVDAIAAIARAYAEYVDRTPTPRPREPKHPASGSAKDLLRFLASHE